MPWHQDKESYLIENYLCMNSSNPLLGRTMFYLLMKLHLSCQTPTLSLGYYVPTHLLSYGIANAGIICTFCKSWLDYAWP